MLVGLVSIASAAEVTEVKIGYLRGAAHKQTISLIDQPADNDGLAGAKLAIEDNNTTGRFLNQRFTLDDRRIGDSDDPAAVVAAMAAQGISLVITDLPAEALLKAADAGRAQAIVLFNVGATDDRLREADCRANVLHIAPTRSMLADALAQYLVWKQWRKWLLVVGSHGEDKLYADALRRAASRFGGKIV
jgi:ABC transporter substrate binding protein (PQQ-dependent alcohol dehydrogenase system)